MTFDAHADRSALRLRLYDNGFTPLANSKKMCLIPEWSTIKVTPELIRSAQWARSKKFLDTGIRCGDVIALDWDIDDKDLLNDLLDEVVGKGVLPESPFVRIGMPPRELWVYRTAEKIGKRTTGHFMPPNPPEDHKGFAVEILGSGCQFAAYGQRDANTAYAWPVESLVDHQYMDLPEITKTQADAVKDFAIAFFEQRGLERRSPAGGTDSGYTHAYDLTPDMVFDVHDMGEMSVAE
ncbi:MAG: bifunctional DNA primase/polymerase, partial [Hyphomicrobium sp.]